TLDLEPAGSWKVTDGSASGSDSGFDDFSYHGQGDYWYDAFGLSIDGSTEQSGSSHLEWSTPWTANWMPDASASDGGSWNYVAGSGAYQAGSGRDANWYNGDGNYSNFDISFDLDAWASTSGTTSESGSSSTSTPTQPRWV